MLARLLSGSCLVAERRFAFLGSSGSYLMWSQVLLENGWDNDRSETQIFTSRVCGSFIKNRQINKQITAHYKHVLQFLFKQLFAVLKNLK